MLVCRHFVGFATLTCQILDSPMNRSHVLAEAEILDRFRGWWLRFVSDFCVLGLELKTCEQPVA